jgi:hypothetical protein
MSGFDRFLRDIGAVTGPGGTSADVAVPEMIEKLRRYSETLALSSTSDDLARTSDYALANEWLSKADKAVEAGDFERAYFNTLNAVLHLGYTARAVERDAELEQMLNGAYEEMLHSAH